MHSLKYPWKDFQIHISSLHAWMRSNCLNYSGCAADYELTFYFSESPSQQTKDRIQMYFDALTEEGEQAKRELDQKREKAKKITLEALPTMSWDGMIPAERKLVLNQSLSNDELDDLIKKHLG